MGRTHPNVLKVRKQKRKGRRAYLTSKFSAIYVPRAVGRDAMAQIPEDAQPLFNYRDRMKGDNSLFDPFMNAILPNVKYSLEPSEEQKLIEMIEHEDVIDCYRVRASPIQKQVITLCFNRKKTVLFFVLADFLQGVVKKSNQFGSEDRALLCLRYDRIRWEYELPLTSLHIILPSR